MRIPTDPVERYLFYQEVAQKCGASIEDRKGFYSLMKSYYNTGTGGDAFECIYNNIYPHLDQLSAFLYSQDNTRLSAEPAATDSAKEYRRARVISRRVQHEWHDSNADVLFGSAVLMSLVYSSMFVKLIITSDGVQPFLVEPHNMGVLREDATSLDGQQAVMHVYHSSLSNLKKTLRDHPRYEQIISRVSTGQKPTSEQESGLTRILTFGTAPNITGQVNIPSYGADGTPQVKVDEDLVKMTELWVWDDQLKDYRVATIAEPDVVVFDRTASDLFLKGELPFVQIAPNPTPPHYFWGLSEVQRLMSLQDLLNERMRDIRRLLRKQAHPPAIGSGMAGQPDELALALDKPDGFVGAFDANWKFQRDTVEIPADLFSDVDRILEMFATTSGLPSVLTGQGEKGVRSMGHASELIRTGSARAKKRALIIEDSLEKVATLYYKAMRKYCPDVLTDDDGQPFVMAQASGDMEIRVDAHSSSAAFSEDQRDLAFKLLEVGAIRKDRLLDLVNVPMNDLLKQDLRDGSVDAQNQAAAAAKQNQGKG